ncbi:MAG: alpha/beta fold hydrolase [Acidobacteria bacterium]|uniref:Alpha/beta fold hydrolase n=1 Tax=Candidatus Polarisedimenticola svalbardensis TaxID=2886004 RepID=A0A8J7CDV5_9BACT|nr:alpha/beta fold hydrolase [Candidatus Polarisedimenticola svalbardensis]
MARVERNTSSIYYEVTGSGPAIVLGHSFLCSGKMWEPQIQPLSWGYQVINVDLRGHGRSGIMDQPFDLYDLVDDVLFVLDHLAVEQAVWAGLSIGGMVALRAALVARERVAGLILLDTDAGAETRVNRLKFGTMVAVTRLLGTGSLVPQVARMFFGRQTRSLNPGLVEEWKEHFSNVPLPAILRTVQALKERDSILERLCEITVPALVIVGEQDRLLPPACSREIVELLNDASLAVIANAGHLPTLERPEATTSAMLSFLGGLQVR